MAEKKHTVFLTVVGAATYKLLRSLLAPVKPGEKPFNDLVTKLNEHYNPAPSLIIQRYRFHSRSRAPGEFVAMFVAQLRSLSEHCKFDTVLEDMLCDRIVCGINDTLSKDTCSRSRIWILRKPWNWRRAWRRQR